MKTCQNLHKKLLKSILESRMDFFQKNQKHQILSRFGRDIGIVDNLLPNYTERCINDFLSLIAGVVLTIVVVPFLAFSLIFLVILLIIVYKILAGRVATLKRMGSKSKLQCVQLYSDVLQGLITIRALSSTSHFLTKLYKAMDVRFNLEFFHSAGLRWLQVWMNILMIFFQTISCLSFVFFMRDVNALYAALALVYLFFTTDSFFGCFRVAVELETAVSYFAFFFIIILYS